MRDSLPARLRSRFEVVRHGVDLEALARDRAARESVRIELGVASDDVVVGTIANLRSQKDYPTLLHAAARVLERSPRARFVLIGQGPLEAEIRELQQQLGLGPRVTLLGRRDDATRVLAGCDVFVLSSRFEGLPVALMEALGLGLPVVATRVGGIPELVTDGVEGLLVPPGAPDRLADALMTVLDDAPRRAAMAAAALARGPELDRRAAVTTIEARYRSLVGVGA